MSLTAGELERTSELEMDMLVSTYPWETGAVHISTHTGESIREKGSTNITRSLKF